MAVNRQELVMPAPSPWSVIHAERAALAHDLDGLPAEAWSTPSLCPPWTVQEMLGHMTATAAMTPPRFVVSLAKSRFKFDEMSRRAAREQSHGTPEEALARFRRYEDATTAPPGPADSWLGETVVHSTDIRWPLSIDHQFPTEALVRVAEFYRRSNVLIGGKRRIVGLRLHATDADWSAGDGPEVAGPMLSLVMAMTGRAAALASLHGPGLDALSRRP
jgi:uncharacterized protein (TIGR03083 family)